MSSDGTISAWNLFFSGGPLMIPILLCSIFAFGIVMEKFSLFRKININISSFKSAVFDLLKHNKIKEALELCEENPSPVAKIIKAGLIKFGCSREEIQESIEEVSLNEIPRLELRLNALGTLAHVTPLIGFLGTMIGMVYNFYSLQSRAAALNPVTSGELAGALATSLLTTVAGLIIAIPTYIAYNYFVNRVNHLITEMERAATELINVMAQSDDLTPNS